MPGARGHLMDHAGKQRERPSREHGLFFPVVWTEPRAGRLFSQEATALLGLLNKVSQSREVAGVHQGTTHPCACGAPHRTSPSSSLAGGTAEDAAGRRRTVCPGAVCRGAGQLVRFTHPPNPSRIPCQEVVL